MTPSAIGAAVAAGAAGGALVTQWLGADRWRHPGEPGSTSTPAWVGAGVVAGVAGVLAWALGGTGGWTAIAVLVAWSVFGWGVSITDIAVRRVPERAVLAAYAVELLALTVGAAATGHWPELGRAVAAAAATWVVFLGWALISGMGFGDVQVMGVSGLLLGWLGWDVVVRGVLFGLLAGGVWAAVLLARGRRGQMAYAPPLLVGVGLAIAVSSW